VLTRRGWLTAGLALALVVAGRVFAMVEGYVAGAVLVLLLLAGMFWLVLTRLDVAVSRTLHPPRVHAGGSTRVDLRVANRARRASPVLTVRDRVSGTRGATLLVAPLAPGAEARAAYRFSADRRGVVEVGPLLVELTDPFGLARLRLPAAGMSELVVYPAIEAVPALPLSAGNDPLAGSEHPSSLGRTGEDFYALRAYVVGDDLRRVHWPATARHDDLMVRQDELPWQGRTTIVLDDRAAVHAPASFERMVSAAASILVAGGRRRDLVRLVTSDGADSGYGAGRSHVEGLLEALSCAEPTAVADVAGAGELLAATGVSGSLVVLTGEGDPDELAAMAARGRTSGTVALLAFSEQPTGGPAFDGPLVRIGPDTGLGAGWAAAVRRARRLVAGGSRA
jgi:uncharacterized protein (DUF58 family)